MKTEIKIEDCESPFCVIHTAEQSEAINLVAERIRLMDANGQQTGISGWDGDYCLPLKLTDVYRIYSMDKKVFIQTEKENLLLKMRLYEFEEQAEKYGWTDFIRISNTDIVNFTHVKNLDMSATGIIKVNFSNGNTAMVSRRYMNKIRGKLCLRKL